MNVPQGLRLGVATLTVLLVTLLQFDKLIARQCLLSSQLVELGACLNKFRARLGEHIERALIVLLGVMQGLYHGIRRGRWGTPYRGGTIDRRGLDHRLD